MTMPSLNLRRIEAFLAVFEARNMTRAAVQLEVAQSVVTRHVAALEAQLGCRLFARTGRGVAPTPAGEQLAPRLRAAIDEMQRAANEAADIGEGPSGIVRLGVVPGAARPLVGMLYQRLCERFPRIGLQFVEGFSNPLEDQMADGQLDLAIVNRYGRAPRRGEERLCVLESLVIGAAGMFQPGQQLRFRQLADYPLVLAARPNGLRVALDQASRRAGVQLKVAVESDSMFIMKDLVVQAGLCTVLPRQAVHDDLAHGQLSAARLTTPMVPRLLSLMSSSRKPGTAATRAVAREIRDIVQHTLQHTAWR
ncbi:MAG: LysR family transcriptional regulator [Burkholderiaceae bacterium]|nr:LysR family transcriptional regulator [Rhodoferax sp.]MCB2028877.1 LysR family transcriptional regulator [Rhodoferax sp.]MCB2042490.1 LysR family transcriptional regulator [Rhodoferax sp.]